MKPHDPLEDLLRRRTGLGAPAGGPLCGDPELLAAYAENALDAAARDEFQAHLAMCNACRESVVALVRIAPREAAAAVAAQAAASNWWRWLWAAPALAVLALVLFRPRPAPAPVAPPQVMTAKNEPPPPPPASAPRVREFSAPKMQRAEPTADSPAKTVLQAEAASKTVDAVEAPVAAAAPPAELQVNARNFSGMNAAPARGPYANQQNNSSVQNAFQFGQKDAAVGGVAPASAPPPALAVKREGTSARVLAKISLPKSEIPVRIEKGVLSISIDAELTWQVVKTPEEVESAKFTDPLNGEMRSVSHVVYRTKDGGKTWVTTAK